MFSGEFKQYYYKEIDSTNLQASALLSENKERISFVVRSDYQKKGKGQAGNIWESPADMNLLCSLVVFPKFLSAGSQFYLAKIISLAIHDLLVGEFEHVTIKWPNDILINGKKVAGILIENSIQDRNILNSIIGVGINVNQKDFPSYPFPATSMINESGTEFSLERIFDILMENFTYWYRNLEENEYEYIDRNYLKNLYRLHEKTRYRSMGEEFEARMVGVNKDGLLMLDTGEKDLLYFSLKEIEFL